jgi:hypothetical protein
MILPFLPLINKILDSVLPDSSEIKLKLATLAQTGELAYLDADVKLALAQSGVNQEEAKSTNWFVAGWRPACGWVSTIGLAYQFLVQPLLAWLSLMTGIPVPPVLDTGTLISLLTGMLGLGAVRTYEKLKDVASG